jgi:hypothetical protein
MPDCRPMPDFPKWESERALRSAMKSGRPGLSEARQATESSVDVKSLTTESTNEF